MTFTSLDLWNNEKDDTHRTGECRLGIVTESLARISALAYTAPVIMKRPRRVQICPRRLIKAKKFSTISVSGITEIRTLWECLAAFTSWLCSVFQTHRAFRVFKGRSITRPPFQFLHKTPYS